MSTWNVPRSLLSPEQPAGEGMVVRTDTDRVEKARKGVAEFLPSTPAGLFEHVPRGERTSTGRWGGFDLPLRETEAHMGPLISTTMTRCIHARAACAPRGRGVPELGAIGRGESMEITTYLEKTLASELSANVIDLCPVGALTSKPYAFTQGRGNSTRPNRLM